MIFTAAIYLAALQSSQLKLPIFLKSGQVSVPAILCLVVLLSLRRFSLGVLQAHPAQSAVAQHLLLPLQASLVMTGAFTLCLFLLEKRLAVFDQVGHFLALLLTYEVLANIIRWYLYRREQNDPVRLVVVGAGPLALKAWRSIRLNYGAKVSLLGFVDNDFPAHVAPDILSRFLGGREKLDELLLQQTIDVIFIALPVRTQYDEIITIARVADEAGVDVVFSEDILGSHPRKKDLFPPDVFGTGEAVPPHVSLALFVKRCIDVVGSAVGLVVLSPLLLVIAIIVKVTSEGPVLFVQERWGYRRRRFRMLKFRTMVKDAPQRMAEIEHLNEANGPIFKLRDDPRVTKVGAILRATSLDEFPQLWNVLVGEMSLVGPRPMSIRDVSLFDKSSLMRRFRVKPGMTGLWQVSGRSEVGFEEWIRFDNEYIDRWSLSLDLAILRRTASVVLNRTGAM